MHISTWATMTRRHPGRQWHCRTGRTINLDYVSPPQAMQWPDGRSRHKAMARLRQLNPALRVSNLKDLVGPWRADDLARYEEGLRQAGLPE
jgi:hypothetical protein